MMEDEQEQQSHRSLIIGGVKAPLGRYPYFVSLSQTQGSEGECGGSLIAPDLFLTAGHCLPERTLHKLKHRDGADADVAWARVGIIAREELNDDFYFVSPNEIEEDFMVLRATRHHHFERLGDDEFRYDYSIVQIKGQSTLPYISLLRDESLLDQTKHPYLRAMGLGWTYVDRPSRANWLHYVDLSWVNNSVCEDALFHSHKRIDKSQLCTYEKGKDSCAYDSGGPLILWAGNTTYNTDWLVGQVSWGIGCANENLPGINSRISTVLDWIDDVVCSWSKNPPPDFNCPQTNITTPAAGTDTTDMSTNNTTTIPTKRRFHFNNGGDSNSKTINNNKNKNEAITLPWLGRADYLLLPAYIISLLLVWKRRRQFYQTIK